MASTLIGRPLCNLSSFGTSLTVGAYREYPGLQGNNNIVSGDDSANLAVFLKTLRKAIGTNKLITMATSQQPFANSNGNPMPSVAAQAQYIDHILIMKYVQAL